MKIDKSQFQPEGSIQKEPDPTPDAGNTPKPPVIDIAGNLGKVKVACIVFAVLIFVLGVRLIGTCRNLSAEVADQKDRIERLTAERDELAGEADGSGAEEETGEAAPVNRSETDSQRAGELLKTLLTWDSIDSYNAARSTLMETYGLSADSQLLTVFIPEQSAETFDATNTAGMEFDSASSYVISEDGDRISYFAPCQVTVTSKDGNTVTGTRVGVFYTLDENGTFSNLTAYTLAS